MLRIAGSCHEECEGEHGLRCPASQQELQARAGVSDHKGHLGNERIRDYRDGASAKPALSWVENAHENAEKPQKSGCFF